MKNYAWILFDADDTLFHFDAFAGLQHMMQKYGVEFNQYDYELYQKLNKSLWNDYQKGKVTAQQIQVRRFTHWGNKLKVDPQQLNSEFLQSMLAVSQLMPGAENLLNHLRNKAQLGIITNGFTDLQQARLERHGFHEHFELVVISEAVGVAKPDKAIFDHALNLMGNPEPHNVLMIGDNPQSDIIGGLNAGLDTCWVNINKQPQPKRIKPHYEVNSLSELHQLFLPIS